MNEVIELNEHRLLNGDATNKDDVEKLIGDCKVNLLLTDPPYGIDIVNIGGGKSVDKAEPQLDHSREREREQWQQLAEQNHQPSTKVGTVGTPAKPGFRNLKEGGA